MDSARTENGSVAVRPGPLEALGERMSRGSSVILISAAAALLPFLTCADALVVRAGRLIDVERGRVLTDQAIHVEGERIARIEPFSAAAGDRVVDWSRYTVAPGLMDMHTHLAGDITSAD